MQFLALALSALSALAFPRLPHHPKIYFGIDDQLVVKGKLIAGDKLEIEFEPSRFYQSMVKADCYPAQVDICYSVDQGEATCDAIELFYEYNQFNPEIIYPTVPVETHIKLVAGKLAFSFATSGNYLESKGSKSCQFAYAPKEKTFVVSA